MRDIVMRAGRKPCLGCGSRVGKFLYAWAPDSVYARPLDWRGPFCGKACYVGYEYGPFSG